jgi:hypothetical protein
LSSAAHSAVPIAVTAANIKQGYRRLAMRVMAVSRNNIKVYAIVLRNTIRP